VIRAEDDDRTFCPHPALADGLAYHAAERASGSKNLTDFSLVDALAWIQSKDCNLATEPGPMLRVLIIEDYADTAESYRMLIGLWGHDVHICRDGSQASNCARDCQPHAVVLDIGLPGLDGYQVARRLREQPESRNAVIIAVSGFGQEKDRQEALKAGCNYHFPKPIAPDVLRELLDKLPAR
jgi:two-component system, OmpR family, response regulator